MISKVASKPVSSPSSSSRTSPTKNSDKPLPSSSLPLKENKEDSRRLLLALEASARKKMLKVLLKSQKSLLSSHKR